MQDVDIVIVGAGAAGLCVATQLDRAGHDDLVILERAAGIGGTWRDNTYPGAACDVPSRLYSFSFEPNPRWSHRFSPQEEILAYLEHCADAWGLRDRIELQAEVVEARFEAEAARWRVHTADGRTWRARVLISAVGQLHRPSIPDLPGLDDFEGTLFHSARWRHDHDLAGRRVGVIGTGASAVQIVPAIADDCAALRVFQRSAHWVLPRWDRPYSELEQALLERVPALERLLRWWWWANHEVRWLGFHAADESWMGRAVRRVATATLRRQVDDEDLREALIPEDAVGCKRVLLSDDYAPTLTRDHVDLVTEGIERIEPSGVRTADGVLHALDTLVSATGFATTDFLAPMRVLGLDGELHATWDTGARAYLGMTVPRFPNLFLLYGPNTNLGHNSIWFMLECQAAYIVQCVQHLVDHDLAWLDVRPEALARYDEAVQERLERTVWSAGCQSWYKTEGGRITNNWPWTTTRYWWATRRPDWSDYVERAQPPATAPDRTPRPAVQRA